MWNLIFEVGKEIPDKPGKAYMIFMVLFKWIVVDTILPFFQWLAGDLEPTNLIAAFGLLVVLFYVIVFFVIVGVIGCLCRRRA